MTLIQNNHPRFNFAFKGMSKTGSFPQHWVIPTGSFPTHQKVFPFLAAPFSEGNMKGKPETTAWVTPLKHHSFLPRALPRLFMAHIDVLPW